MSVISSSSSSQVEPLVSFFKRLTTVIEINDLNHYKAESQSQEVSHKVHKLKKLLGLSPYISYEFSDTQLAVLLFSSFAGKDVNKTYIFLVLLLLSNGNQLITNDINYKHNYSGIKTSEIKLSGMDNWNSVLCYLDSLLFAMFGRIDDYDSSVLVSDDEESLQIKEFKLGLRLLINLMRSGEATITTDLVQVFCNILAELGFKDAVSKKQQDVVSCFEILCDFLNVPLLTLKIDIMHSGKVDINDDLKYMSERVLFISVPEEQIGDLKSDTILEEEDPKETNKISFSKIMKGKRSKKDKDDIINLEECLNNYFNNSVKVKRVLQRRRTLTLEKATSSHTSSPVESRRSYEITPETSNSSTALEDNPTSIEDLMSNSDRDLLSEEDLRERNEFLDIVSYNNDIVEPVPVEGMKSSLLYSTPSRTSCQSNGSSSINRTVDDASPFSPGDEDLINKSSTSSDNIQGHNYNKDHLKRTLSSPLQATFKPSPLRHSRRDSMSKISKIITLTRSRSTTDATVLSNPIIKRANSTTLSQTPNSGLEVTLPAWMFLQLLPYYSDFGSDDTDDLKKDKKLMSDEKVSVEMVENTEKEQQSKSSDESNEEKDVKLNNNPVRKAYAKKRPIVPICLKRYIYNDKGKTQKINKKFKIPTIIDLPYFVADDRPTEINNEQTNKSFDRFRLVLESAVCHRGNSVDSGHYVAASRKYPYVPSKNKKNKEEEETWLLFNDLKDSEEKITETTFKQILDNEAPYLLFYRIEEHDFKASDVAKSSASTIRKVDTADNSIISNPSIFKDKTFLDKISNGSTLDARDLRKNSVISNLSQVSSMKKEREDELKLINSQTSTIGSTSAPSVGSQMAPPSAKPTTDSTVDDSKSTRHQHHGFSFTRSLSRSSSRPPLTKKDTVTPDNPEYIDYGERYFWYYKNDDGTFGKQNKYDDTRTLYPVLGAPSFRTESLTSDTSDLTSKDFSKELSLTKDSSTSKETSHHTLEPVNSPSKNIEVPIIKTPEESLLTPIQEHKVLSPVSTSTIVKDNAPPKKESTSNLQSMNSKISFSRKKSQKKNHNGKKSHDDKCIVM